MKQRKLLTLALTLVACLLCSIGAAAAEAYACYTESDSTLTFYYDNYRSSRTGTTYDLNTGSSVPLWYSDGTCSSVTQVVFDPSFANAHPTSTYAWFVKMSNLTSITNMQYYLKTNNVTNMGFMFYQCSSLTSIDLSGFNTSNVTNMRCMFYSCNRLKSLDLSNFNTAKVTKMESMFSNCSSLTTIYAGDDWSTAAVTSSIYMFIGCNNLAGGKGTVYDASHVDKAYAHIDGGPDNPGYFTAKPAFRPGDVNGDDLVDVADVSAIIAHVLGKTPLDSRYLSAANVNGDSDIDIADVTLVINMVLGK